MLKPILTNKEGKTVLFYSTDVDRYVIKEERDVRLIATAMAEDMRSTKVLDVINPLLLLSDIDDKGIILLKKDSHHESK